ncbi:MAG: 50S ribosomal protein L21 [bacterium]|nr:50S ribosomal protein L21 [bacterium]
MSAEKYAVIKTGGKQYRVIADDILEIEKVAGDAGSTVSFDEVLMIGGEGAPTVGSPMIEGASVSAEVIEQKRGRKIIVFKKKRRKNYRRKNGHRQELTKVKILEVIGKGEKASKKATAKPTAEKNTSGAITPLFTAPAGDADDLKKISGVGPALEKKLNDLGITTYKQVSGLSKDEIAKVDDALSFKGRIDRDEWLMQAKKLGDEKK